MLRVINISDIEVDRHIVPFHAIYNNFDYMDDNRYTVLC